MEKELLISAGAVAALVLLVWLISKAGRQQQEFTAEEIERHAEYVRRGALLLTDAGEWTNTAAGRAYYERLSAAESGLLHLVLVRVLLAHPAVRRQVLCLAIKIGRPGSEDRLIQALSRFGDKLMAEDFLNCGAPELAKGARRWAERRGYRITHRAAGQSATWGEF
ncbi:hypothetical protein [Kribbella endophytica]